jgi:hypothetical protein
MRSGSILVLLWFIASGLWVQYAYSALQQPIAESLSQIAALDECDSIYPPRPDGYAQQYSNTWGNWEYTEHQRHPRCAPAVGNIGFFDFVGMQTEKRASLRQQEEDKIRAATRAAVIRGATVPIALLFVGVAVAVLIRRARPR